ncbi:hypothetical protein [Mycolicibacterium elephantis]|uniref:Uncharacterized protein n=1 Tax=Mycolicibacterium elephantis DSM 44368 TaxID=1335622 RepID=A0A439DMB4_9MYCO|nr:hypothetical protein [Mycolicibacterium elephantis]MCV7220155.1 hypothetical protein [Mycolicibacterium elephantis]RWA15994.1 hypothetical protein MELE44368_08110 [Mycolicibacterium elephantis DSM 44368]
MNDVVAHGINLMAAVLAQQQPNPGPEFGKASPFGLLVIVLLLIGTFLLVWSMNRHLRKVPKSFEADDELQQADGDDGDPGPSGTDPQER